MHPRSGADPDAQWPPKSPHDVLMSTPGGRERLRRLAERTSPSPSPSKRSRATPALGARSANPRRDDAEVDDGIDVDDDEDEEMLQLKLAAIQAKLKLKKLQSARAKKDVDVEPSSSRPEPASIPNHAATSRSQSRAEAMRLGQTLPRPQSQVEVQVPASPVRRAQTAQGHTSPSRVRLGIDKGLKAKDISLKRVPSVRRPQEGQNGSQGGYLRRARTPAPGATNQERPKTFSERLAESRAEETGRRERQERIKKLRTNAFDLGKQEMDQFKNSATEIPDISIEAEQYSRDEVVAGGGIKRSSTMPSLGRQDEDQSANSFATSEPCEYSGTTTRKNVPPSEVPEEEASAFEPYSSVHLSKRIIPHPVLTRNLAGKKTYVIKDLLKHVKAPDFQLAEVEQDIVVFAILASKSEPRAHKNTSNLKEKTEVDPARGKFMVLKLVDLQWELELFLFNTGFERYWKLIPGTLIAILNPTIMPPPPGRTDTGRFSLVINSGQDTILEVGNARDLGFCKSVKKGGEYCSSWVNRKRTEYCEFHMNLALSKKQQARQDVNAFNTGLGPNSKKKGNSYRLPKWEEHANDPKKSKRGKYDRETHSAWFMHKPSAAAMLDNEVLGGNYGQVTDTVERSQALRRRLATQEKERDIMKKLGQVGSGAGKEYMSMGPQKPSNPKDGFGSSMASSTTQATEDGRPPQLDAKALGLVHEKGSDRPKIHLSPVKRKRVDSAMSWNAPNSSALRSSSSVQGTNTANSKVGLGWGAPLKDKLSRMKEGEKLAGRNSNKGDEGDSSEVQQVPSSSVSGGAPPALRATTTGDGNKDRARSPARKKTRFVTEKGIREAGRESLGDELVIANANVNASGADADARKGKGSSGKAKGVRMHGRGMVVLDDDDDDDLLILD
ncbi:Uu.00g124350.m01.CDS01 [Anthostomella pinea]|uniref:Uu.00g124350.m01.CDS01 n=1 Tax=Anthostomella pinea TaxID=933095 RepID=A0AAI8YHL5_9PEZI|nr:Uu.00g124350.m01.CDS01 [Anthostomella pinea]